MTWQWETTYRQIVRKNINIPSWVQSLGGLLLIKVCVLNRFITIFAKFRFVFFVLFQRSGSVHSAGSIHTTTHYNSSNRLFTRFISQAPFRSFTSHCFFTKKTSLHAKIAPNLPFEVHINRFAYLYKLEHLSSENKIGTFTSCAVFSKSYVRFWQLVKKQYICDCVYIYFLIFPNSFLRRIIRKKRHCLQQAVWRKRGSGSPEGLCKFGSFAPVRTAV